MCPFGEHRLLSAPVDFNILSVDSSKSPSGFGIRSVLRSTFHSCLHKVSAHSPGDCGLLVFCSITPASIPDKLMTAAHSRAELWHRLIRCAVSKSVFTFSCVIKHNASFIAQFHSKINIIYFLTSSHYHSSKRLHQTKMILFLFLLCAIGFFSCCPSADLN